jgi:hypothetical protein
MITCSVCGRENDDLSVVCSSCKGYLQGRADALDLFATLWGLIEKPSATFKRIVLAKHKNYALLLSSLFGICLVFDIAWYKSVGRVLSSLVVIVGAALSLGPIIGMLIVFLCSTVLMGLTKAIGGTASRRNLFAATAYATMPMAICFVFVVPLEIAIFGIDFFGTNPPPMLIKPVEYVLLIALKGVAATYMLYLLVIGTMAANAFGKRKLPQVAGIVAGLVALGFGIIHFLRV